MPKNRKKKGISLIGRAAVLHTEGWVFKSPIPYNNLLNIIVFNLAIVI
jgi:hypothetical protein